MLDIGGARVYISGDTDVYGDLAQLGQRYQPNVAMVTIGNGPFTQGPEDAALACKLLGVTYAIPVHYAHNPLVRGVEAGPEFERALARIAPGIQTLLMKPGETRTIQV
jgi:L-ascorbate metabolism protein UlaG (beta-lactamase superfamily)